jgi:soluble lytic murein transglycosylase-like protein
LLAASALRADSSNGGSVAAARDGPEVCQRAVLRNGFTLQYVRREAAGTATRLWVCAEVGDGYVEIPTERIARFEPNWTTVTSAPARAAVATAGTMLLSRGSIKKLISGAAGRHQIDPDFVASVVKAESGFHSEAVSAKGARGLMQLMPRTAASLGVDDALDPAANVEGGTKYLRQLLDQYNGDAVKALAAYNAGPQCVAQYGGMPPYRETRAYVARVIHDFNRKKLDQQAGSRVAKH